MPSTLPPDREAVENDVAAERTAPWRFRLKKGDYSAVPKEGVAAESFR
jgi:hypothetical protein